MKRLSEARYANVTLTVEKLDSGKFELNIFEPGRLQPLRVRAKTVEELVPLGLSMFSPAAYHEEIREVVYDADDAEYAAHADERSEYKAWCIAQAERDRVNALPLEPYTSK
jgi:hypothetical protein